LLQRSALYLTPPWGMLEQPPFINAAVQLDTGMTPHVLLGALLEIERKAGRIRAERNGPRILDLDLLHVEGVRVDDDDLVLPHPRLAERVFVLLPLNDVAPALELPGHGTVAQVLAQLDAGACQRLP
jgi:2-amino-4-hydroxy-6-hydroxymethyldihydropteridine diphosphokinase